MSKFSNWLRRVANNFCAFIDEYIFNVKWQCLSCGAEIFNDEYFCSKCGKELPKNNKHKCNHCGRKTIADEEYCSTCKNVLTNVELCRSPFVYDGIIKKLIKDYKYNDKRYLANVFADYVYQEYLESGIKADVVTYVPMTKVQEKRRGFNQSKLLAEHFCKKSGLELKSVFTKEKDTAHQATLNREERLKNLEGSFKMREKSAVKDKGVLIIDDVTTTGATIGKLSDLLIKHKARKVYLLTIASVPTKHGY